MDMYPIEQAFPTAGGRAPGVPAPLPNNGHYTGGSLEPGSCVEVLPTVGAFNRLLIADGGNPAGAFHMASGIRPGNNAPDLALVACPDLGGYCVPRTEGGAGGAGGAEPVAVNAAFGPETGGAFRDWWS